MALSIRARNLIAAGALGTFVLSVYGYTFRQMSRDDFHDLEDGVVKVNVHQSGIRATPPREH